jgi:hypothetical protein
MAMISLGPFAPDASSFNREAIDTVRGMMPSRDGWNRFPGLVSASDALSSRPIGAVEAIDPADGATYIYAATRSGMFLLDTSSTPYAWTDVSNASIQPYTLSEETMVSFTVFGDKIIAANRAWPGLQVATIGSGSFSTIAGAPTAAFVETFGDRVWALGQTLTPNRVEYSAPRNHTVWGDVNRGADFQVFEAGGEVTGGAVVGDVLYVFQTDAIQGFSRVGGQVIFARQELRQKFGAPSRQSIVNGPGGAYFLSEDGFYLAGPGGQIQSIGSQIVDDWFMSNQVDLAKLWSVQGAHDPVNKFILWRYGSSGFAGDGFTDRALGYQYALQRWFPLRLNCAWLVRASSPQILADAIDDLADDVDLSVDTRVYDGGRPQLAGFTSDFKFGFFSGGAIEAEIETANVQFASGRRAFVSGFRPVIEGTNNYTGTIGVKDTPTDAVTWNSASSPNRGGMITQRADGLSHRFRVTIPAGESWSTLSAIEVDGVQPSGWA